MEQNNTSYMPIAIRFAVIFGIITTVLGLAMNYYIVSAEPSQSLLFIPTAFGVVVCLVAAFAGFFVVKNYAQSVPFAVPAGKGAVIGLVVGVLIAVVGLVFNLIWRIVDPNLARNVMDVMVRSLDTMQMDPAARDATMDQMMANDPSSMKALFMNTGIGAAVMGILNLITGIIGAAVYGKKDKEAY